jgi:FAD dependent oxidoreductase
MHSKEPKGGLMMSQRNGSSIGKRAVVIGAGLSGLAAAGALANHFDEVVILERDELHAEAVTRSGVPQGKHPHLLLSGGMNALSELFPGFERDLLQAGALAINVGCDIRLEVSGVGTFPRREWNIPSYCISRPLLERIIRERVKQKENLSILDRRNVHALEGSPDGSAVTGVRYQCTDGNSETISADLVIDASAHAAPTMSFLKSTGSRLPDESIIGVDIHYLSTTFTLPKDSLDDTKVIIIQPKIPESHRAGFLIAAERNTFQVAIAGRGKNLDVEGDEGFLN